MDLITGILTGAIEQLHAFLGNYGLAIVALTLLIRLLILPLTASQTRSMKRMQEIQPELQKLQKKYKGDPEKLNKKTMELFQQHKVNPLAGCLPLLVQLPILYAFFLALRDYDFLSDPSFLWVPDLAAPDPTYILPALTAITTFWMSKMTLPANAEGPQKIMIYGMPIMIGWISMTFPSGLALYWTTSNVFSVGQQYVLQRRDQEGGTQKGPGKGKKGNKASGGEKGESS